MKRINLLCNHYRFRRFLGIMLKSVCGAVVCWVAIPVTTHAAMSPADPLNGNTLLLSSEKRQQIEQHRNDYLHPKPPTPKVAAAKKPAKPKVHLPKNLAVSAVIVTPDGRKIVRINGDYTLPKNENVRLDSHETGRNSVAFELNGQKVKVPVGYNYQPENKAMVKNYQSEPLAMSSEPDNAKPQYQSSAIDTKPTPPAKKEILNHQEMGDAEQVFSERRFRENQEPAKDTNVSWQDIKKMAREREETDEVQPFNEENKYAKDGKVDWETIKAKAKALSENED